MSFASKCLRHTTSVPKEMSNAVNKCVNKLTPSTTCALKRPMGGLGAGVVNSFQYHTHEIQHVPQNALFPYMAHRHRPKTLEELWDVLQKVWDEDLTAAKLECAFRLLTPVMAAITAKSGYNNFRLPHSGIRKEMREDGWGLGHLRGSAI
jgi:hypothetical protein